MRDQNKSREGQTGRPGPSMQALESRRMLTAGVTGEPAIAAAFEFGPGYYQSTLLRAYTSASEGSTVRLALVTLNDNWPQETITVNYTIAGTATTGEDHTFASGSVDIPAGEQTGYVYGSIKLDDTVENLETITLKVESGDGYKTVEEAIGTGDEPEDAEEFPNPARLDVLQGAVDLDVTSDDPRWDSGTKTLTMSKTNGQWFADLKVKATSGGVPQTGVGLDGSFAPAQVRPPDWTGLISTDGNGESWLEGVMHSGSSDA